MSETKSSQLRRELLEEIAERITFIKGNAEDRVGVIWALKMIAEKVRELDENDRLEGFLPLQIRPPAMLTQDEVALAAHALRNCKGIKECGPSDKSTALMGKLERYLEARGQGRTSNHE